MKPSPLACKYATLHDNYLLTLPIFREVSDDEQCSVSVHCYHRLMGIPKKTIIDLPFVTQDIALSALNASGIRGKQINLVFSTDWSSPRVIALRMVDGKLQVVVSTSESLVRIISGFLSVLRNKLSLQNRPEIGKLVPVSDSIIRACPR